MLTDAIQQLEQEQLTLRQMNSRLKASEAQQIQSEETIRRYRTVASHRELQIYKKNEQVLVKELMKLQRLHQESVAKIQEETKRHREAENKLLQRFEARARSDAVRIAELEVSFKFLIK